MAVSPIVTLHVVSQKHIAALNCINALHSRELRSIRVVQLPKGVLLKDLKLVLCHSIS